MKKEKVKEEPKTETEDRVFEFSLPKDAAGQVEQLAEELGTEPEKLFKLFILRGIRAFALVKKVQDRPKRMKAAKGKPAKKKALKAAGGDNLAVIDLRNLSPKTLAFLRRFAAQQNIPLAKQIERSLDDGYGQAD